MLDGSYDTINGYDDHWSDTSATDGAIETDNFYTGHVDPSSLGDLTDPPTTEVDPDWASPTTEIISEISGYGGSENGGLESGGGGGEITGDGLVATGTLSSDMAQVASDIFNNVGTLVGEPYTLGAGLGNALQSLEGTVTAGSSSGVSWASNVVTFAFGSAGQDNISSAIAAPEQAVIEQALQQWSDASGLTFEEVVPSAGTPDLTICYADLDTPTTGLVGLTTTPTAGDNVTLTAGAISLLEDPSQMQFITNAAGQESYAGTGGVTLLQDALHEIGHGLGLGDSSDPTSIMYATLGSANPTLAASDFTNIQALYGLYSSAPVPAVPAGVLAIISPHQSIQQLPGV